MTKPESFDWAPAINRQGREELDAWLEHESERRVQERELEEGSDALLNYDPTDRR